MWFPSIVRTDGQLKSNTSLLKKKSRISKWPDLWTYFFQLAPSQLQGVFLSRPGVSSNTALKCLFVCLFLKAVSILSRNMMLEDKNYMGGYIINNGEEYLESNQGYNSWKKYMKMIVRSCFLWSECKNTNTKPSSELAHVSVITVSPPVNLLMFYDTPQECSEKTVSSEIESYSFEMESL